MQQYDVTTQAQANRERAGETAVPSVPKSRVMCLPADATWAYEIADPGHTAHGQGDWLLQPHYTQRKKGSGEITGRFSLARLAPDLMDDPFAWDTQIVLASQHLDIPSGRLYWSFTGYLVEIPTVQMIGYWNQVGEGYGLAWPYSLEYENAEWRVVEHPALPRGYPDWMKRLILDRQARLQRWLDVEAERRRQGQPPMSVYLRTAAGTTAPTYWAVHTRESTWESAGASR